MTGVESSPEVTPLSEGERRVPAVRTAGLLEGPEFQVPRPRLEGLTVAPLRTEHRLLGTAHWRPCQSGTGPLLRTR